MPWNEAYERMTNYAQSRLCTPSSPPKPLILAGWAYSNDVEKMRRWEETLAWAEKNGCANLAAGIPDQDFYFVDAPTSYAVGPLGGPMYRPWDSHAKDRPTSAQIAQLMDTLLAGWSEIAGQEIAYATRPLAFTGGKARRLLVLADASVTPPWGGWAHLSTEESMRRTFSRLRVAINRAIAPHEVDHVDFTPTKNAAQGVQRHAVEMDNDTRMLWLALGEIDDYFSRLGGAARYLGMSESDIPLYVACTLAQRTATFTDLHRFIDRRFLEAAAPVLEKTNGHIASVEAQGEQLAALVHEFVSHADSKLEAADESPGWQAFIEWVRRNCAEH